MAHFLKFSHMGNPVPVTGAPDPTAEPELSLAEHEQRFGGADSPVIDDRSTPATEAPTSPDEPEPSEEPAPPKAEPRDDKGRFRSRSPRDRKSANQQATREDVPRIHELTQKLREAERDRDSWKAKAEIPPTAAPAKAEPARPPAATTRAKPQPNDLQTDGTPKYQTYEEYLDDRDAYNREQWQAEQQQREVARDAQAQLRESWTGRVNSAREKHDDFDQVALSGSTKIPEGSIVDAWILEDADGAELLYHLQSHDDELTALLAQPPFQQVKTLTLLGQRLSSSVAQGNAATGAVAREPIKVPPRPPTPVRTVAQRAPEEPPDEDASLAAHEQFYGDSRRRRH